MRRALLLALATASSALAAAPAGAVPLHADPAGRTSIEFAVSSRTEERVGLSFPQLAHLIVNDFHDDIAAVAAQGPGGTFTPETLSGHVPLRTTMTVSGRRGRHARLALRAIDLANGGGSLSARLKGKTVKLTKLTKVHVIQRTGAQYVLRARQTITPAGARALKRSLGRTRRDRAGAAFGQLVIYLQPTDATTEPSTLAFETLLRPGVTAEPIAPAQRRSERDFGLPLPSLTLPWTVTDDGYGSAPPLVFKAAGGATLVHGGARVAITDVELDDGVAGDTMSGAVTIDGRRFALPPALGGERAFALTPDDTGSRTMTSDRSGLFPAGQEIAGYLNGALGLSGTAAYGPGDYFVLIGLDPLTVR